MIEVSITSSGRILSYNNNDPVRKGIIASILNKIIIFFII
jgi:hypothetical protein